MIETDEFTQMMHEPLIEQDEKVRIFMKDGAQFNSLPSDDLRMITQDEFLECLIPLVEIDSRSVELANEMTLRAASMQYQKKRDES